MTITATSTPACAQFANGLVLDAIDTCDEALDLAHDDGASPDVLREIEGHLTRFESAR